MIYVFYGERIIDIILEKEIGRKLSADQLKLCYLRIYKNFIQEIDAIDNGVPICPAGVEPQYSISTNLSARVAKLNPTWLEVSNDADLDARFKKAMSLVGEEFQQSVIRTATIWLEGREIVREALIEAKKKSSKPETLLLKRFCPWKEHLQQLEKEYDVVGVPKLVIFRDTADGSWRVSGVPLDPGNFLGRKYLPEPWRGKRAEELSQLTGIKDLIFVHHSGFIGGAKTLEAAMEMANKSNSWTD